MGNPGREVVREAMKGIVSKIAAGGVPAGIGGNSPTDHEGIADLVGLGARFVTISALALLGVGVKQFREGIDAAIREALSLALSLGRGNASGQTYHVLSLRGHRVSEAVATFDGPSLFARSKFDETPGSRLSSS